jgi:hypothetical protein
VTAGSLDELVAAIAPYRLPPELARFWQSADPPKLRTRLFPELIGPELALTLHRENIAAFPLGGPPLLLPVAYESHVFRSVDLGTGEVWQWAWDEDAYELVYPSVADLVDAARRGEPERPSGRRIERHVDAWPVAWLEASGIDLRDREPRGATHTIDSLLRTRPGTVPGQVRIAGVVVQLAGVGFDMYPVVDDGTGQLPVRVPAGTSPWLPVHGRRFELDVTLGEDGAVANAVRPLD